MFFRFTYNDNLIIHFVVRSNVNTQRYIKKKNLNKGRIITADATLKKVFAGGNMFKLAGALNKHIK